MPQSLPIQTIPNQSFIATCDGNLFDITIHTTNGVTSVSIQINGVDKVQNMRAVAGSPIIPYQYLEAGNLMFLTNNQDLPDYNKFNTSQSLAFFSAAELAAYRAAPVVPITADDFNPLGALPLRFSPQGYS